MEQEVQTTFDLDSYKRAAEDMVAKNSGAYGHGNSFAINLYEKMNSLRVYTPEEVLRIVESGSRADKLRLSEHYFSRNGYYKHILIHYATILKYSGLLIPNFNGTAASGVTKKYNAVLDYLEKLDLPIFYTNCALQALIYGSYFGAITKKSKKELVVIDLPPAFCRSNFKDLHGIDLVEFNVTYFDTITDADERKQALHVYPAEISSWYKKYTHGKGGNSKVTPWVCLPSDVGVCFPMFDGMPPFLSVIPRTLEYDDAIADEQNKADEEVNKIVVQKMPHLTDGRLLFEPDEAKEFHSAAVGMLKGNKNIKVLTTYADVDSIGSKGSINNTEVLMQRMEQNIYAEAGVSGQIFATTTATAIRESLNNDMAFMLAIAEKFARFTTFIINKIFKSGNLTYKYTILPITHYNTDSFIDSAFKLVGSGYSLLLPSLALGISQKDLVNIKELENKVLKLPEKLIPLQTSYTQGNDSDNNEGGRPEKDQEDKAETTITVEESKGREA